MDNIEKKVIEGNNSFIKHVFNFDNETKNDLMNIIQYIIVALIPCSLANHFVDSIIPEADDSKSNLEISVEVAGHLILMFVLFLFIHRLTTYVPTYSGTAYNEINLITLVLAVIVLGYDSKTKFGKKIKILVERLQEMWDGKAEKTNKKGNNKGGNNVKITQPISSLKSPIPTHQVSRADYLNTHNQMTPPQVQQVDNTQNMTNNNSGATNDMYNNGGFGGLVGANQPMMQEPMAANSVGGFSAW